MVARFLHTSPDATIFLLFPLVQELLVIARRQLTEKFLYKMGEWYIGKIFELEVPETFQAQNDPVSITNLNSHYFLLNL